MRAAYSSGHPALGVGAGNTPALIDATADIKNAVSSILLSKVSEAVREHRCAPESAQHWASAGDEAAHTLTWLPTY